MSYLLFSVGLLLLFVGGDVLVRGAIALALRLSISKVAVATVVIGFGTSAPELLVSAESAALGHPLLALGNVAGSNIANFLLIGGIGAVIGTSAAVPVSVNRDLWILLGISLVVAVVAMLGPMGTWFGIALLAGLGLYTLDCYRRAGRVPPPIEEIEADSGRPVWLAAVMALAGLGALVLGADLVIEGAVDIATRLGVDELVIGLTLVALGSSLPELAVTVMAGLRREGDVAIGNVVGSNVFNLAGALGLAAVIAPIPTDSPAAIIDLWIMMAVTVFIALVLFTTRRISRPVGILLLALYAAFITLEFGLF